MCVCERFFFLKDLENILSKRYSTIYEFRIVNFFLSEKKCTADIAEKTVKNVKFVPYVGKKIIFLYHCAREG